MKLGLVSDLHLEFGDLDLPNTDNVETLILSGDVCIASKVTRFVPFFERVAAQFPHVVYVMGNHEHYNGKFDESEDTLREALAKFSNIYLLEKHQKIIGDIVFLGGTLWTDLNNYDPLTKYHVTKCMNDYNIVRVAKKGYKKLNVEDTLEAHRKTLDFFKHALREHCSSKVVVVGHHAPTHLSTKPRYENDILMNGAYRSDLSEFILNNPQIKLWSHGHTHSTFDYMVGSTRVVCNPRGYWNHEVFTPGYKYQLLEV